jgi:hypothetical protein
MVGAFVFRMVIVSRICRIFVITFAVRYAVAFALYLIGTYGWFGSPQGPLAGVFLVPWGLPWILGLDVLPSAMLPAAAIAAPALNLGLWCGRCRWRARR